LLIVTSTSLSARGEDELTERAQVGRRQVGQLAAADRLDRGVTNEGGQPRMREPPLAVGPRSNCSSAVNRVR